MRQFKITTQITSRDSPAVEKYLQEISKIPMVTSEEEVTLTQQIKAGDQKAIERLVKANLRFVVSVAKQYQHQGLSLSDLVNEGNIGLIKAAQRFDETRGFKFVSYAVWWIRQSILQAIANEGRLVRLPMNKQSDHTRTSRAYAAFEQEHEREPSVEELSGILELSSIEINTILQNNNRHTSLDALVHEAENITIGDLLESGSVTDARMETQSLQQQIRNLLGILKPREAEIIAAFYKIDGENTPSMSDIEKKYNLSKGHLCQLKKRAMRQLRQHSASKLLRKSL